MLAGSMEHRDNQGNAGLLGPGSVQWMTAGRGIVHSEMPTQDSAGLHGFQLWVNLPRSEKMSEPRYRDVPAAELARATGAGFEATAVAGQWQFGDTRLQGPLRELEERAGVGSRPPAREIVAGARVHGRQAP